MRRGMLANHDEWMHPALAVQLISDGLDISDAAAVEVLVRRLISKKITAALDHYIGPKSEDHHLFPEYEGMPIWPGLWLDPALRSPSSSVWSSGDLEGTIAGETAILLNLRFKSADVVSALSECGCNKTNDISSEGGSNTVKTSKRDRRPRYDSEAFIRQAVEILKDEGGFGPAFQPAAMHRHLESWCNERWPHSPSRSWMYERFDEAERRYLTYISELQM